MNKVREIRLSQGVSQTALARKLKMAAPNLSVVERERAVPSERLKKRIARALKTPVDVLFPEAKDER